MFLHDHHLPHSSHGYSFREQFLETQAFKDWMGTSYDDGSLDGECGEKDFAEQPDSSSSSSSSSYRNKEEREKKTSKSQLVGENYSVILKKIHCRESFKNIFHLQVHHCQRHLANIRERRRMQSINDSLYA